MNWFRENPFVAGLAALTVVATGALLFVLSGAIAQYGEVSDAYSQAVTKLQKLQNRSPYPSAENLEKTMALETQYRTELNALQTQLAALEVPLNMDVSPQQFQDDLRAAVNEVTEAASAGGVVLPSEFFFGFNRYVNSPPEDRAAPYLARELVVIKDLVANLIDVKVESIDSLERQPLPQEQPGKSADATVGIVEPYVFNVTFTADQSKFRVIFNNVLKSNRFLIIRALNVANTSQEGPPVVPQQDPTSLAMNPSPTGVSGLAVEGVEGSNELNVILGREQVKVSLQLEMIDFTAPVAEAKK